MSVQAQAHSAYAQMLTITLNMLFCLGAEEPRHSAGYVYVRLSVHIAGAHALRIYKLVMCMWPHPTVLDNCRHKQDHVRFQQERLKRQEVGLQGIRENDRPRSAKNADYTS